MVSCPCFWIWLSCQIMTDLLWDMTWPSSIEIVCPKLSFSNTCSYLPESIDCQPKFHQHGHECLLISSDPQSPAWAKLVRSKLKYLYEQLLPMIERLSKERFWILQALLLLYTGWIFSVHCAISTAQNWKSQLSVASYVRMLYSAKALHESKSDFLVSAKRKKIIIQLTLQSQTVPS